MSIPVKPHGWAHSVGLWPDATNTGPVAGTTFTAVPGSLTSGTGWAWDEFDRVRVTGNNAVLDGLDITGPVVIDAADVTIQNCKITIVDDTGSPDGLGGTIPQDQDCILIRASEGGHRPTITHCELGSAGAYRARSNIRTSGNVLYMTASYNDCSGAGNGITIEYEGIATWNWVHDLGHFGDDHHSGLSNHGGATANGVTYRHNKVLLNGQTGLSGAITVYSDFAAAQNVNIDNNLISGGAYVIYAGESGGAWVDGTVNNIKITDNEFMEDQWVYGPLGTWNASRTGNELTGNIYYVSRLPVAF